MQHLRLLVKHLADAVAAVFAHHGTMIRLGVVLNGRTDVAESDSRLYHFDADAHGFVADARYALGDHRGLADKIHLTGVTVIAVLDDGDINVDDVALLEDLVTGDAVTHLMVDRGADGFRIR